MLLRSIATAFGLALALNTAQAAEPRFELDLEAQDLESALTKLATEADIKIRYAPDAPRSGQSAPALHGRYGLRQALDELLAGTGLTYDIDPSGVVTIKQRAGAADASLQKTEAVRLPALTVTASQMPSYPTSGYRVDSSFGATKTDTPLIETPGLGPSCASAGDR